MCCQIHQILIGEFESTQMKHRETIAKNNLMAANPSLAKEWHSTKNDKLTPKDVMPNSHKRV
jgi:hypothetical protein